MFKLIAVFFSTLMCCLGVPSCPAMAAETAIDLNAVSEARIDMIDISKPNRQGKSFQAATLMNAPIQKLCSTIQDYPDYPSFMPNVGNANVIQTSAEYSLVNMTIKLPFGKIKKYRLKMEPKVSPNRCQLSWKLVPWPELKTDETIVDTNGTWLFTPSPLYPDKTIVQWVGYTDPGAIPLGFGWIVDSLSKDSIPQTLEALRTKMAAPTQFQ